MTTLAIAALVASVVVGAEVAADGAEGKRR